MYRKKFFCSIAAFLVLFLSEAVFGFETRETVNLTLNAPVSREFNAGGRDFYSAEAREGEVVEIVCEKNGVDIALTVFDSKGEKVSVSNSPTGFAGFERLFFLAENTGEYKIEVTSRRLGNTAGKYTIVLRDRHEATENDQRNAKAMRLLGESREILFGTENRLEKAEKALDKLEKALELFQKTGDLQGQTVTLFQIGLIDGYELGEKANAIGAYEKALEIWTNLKDEAGKAICLTYLADEIRDYDTPDKPRSGYLEKAQSYFDQAIILHRKLNNKSDEATTLSYLCRFYNDTQKFQKGFDACRESLKIEADTDPLTNYRTYTNLASLYGNSGDLETAQKYNKIALERLKIVENYLSPYRKAFIKGNIGGLYLSQKNYEAAEMNLREALELSEEVKQTVYAGYLQVRLALIDLETNRYSEAHEYALKAVEIYRKNAPVKIQAALNALGKVQSALGLTESARQSFTEAVERNRINSDRYAEAESLYNLAKLEKNAGNLDIAHESIERAINNSEIIRAEIFGKNQRTSYLSILKKYYELEIELLIKLHEKTADARFLEAAWQKHERIRARSLMENLIETGLNVNEFVPADFFEKEKFLLEKIAAAEFKRAESVKTKNLEGQRSAEAELNKALSDYGVLQESFRQKNPQFSAVNHPRDFVVSDAQKLIDDDTAILEFALGEQQSYVWVIRKNSFQLVNLPSKKAIEPLVRNFHRALTDRSAKNEQTIIETSKNLSREILLPVVAELANINRIVVIADGALQLTPFSALTLLPDNAYEPLSSNIEIVNAPSFSSLVFLRENKSNRVRFDNKLLAVFADPIFQNDDERFSLKKSPNQKNKTKMPDISENLTQALRDFGFEQLARLPFSGVEAREIGKFAPEQTLLALGTDASRQNFMRGDFNSYRILHFATHGFLNQQNPELSGLVLSLYDENRSIQNGFLRVIDLYSMHLNSDLVVLSACQTALGKEIDGEGIVGLTRGFMYAGASGVVSSLWKVEDAATAELMKRFYRAMIKENQTPSAALRTAQNEMRRIPRFKSPQNWAGFTLNGEWK